MRKLIFLFFIGLLSCNSQKRKLKVDIHSKKNESKTVEKLSGKEIIAQLEKLDFFNLTDSSELEKVKIGFEKSYMNLNFFQGPMRGETLNFMDNRYHWIDCEALFEIGGLTEYLTSVKPTFEKLGLKLNFTNEKSEQNQNKWKHTIELNGIEYVAFDGAFSNLDWGISYVNFIKMLNAELENQHSKNRFYPIMCDNGGAIVLLTFKQFDFVKKHYPNNNEHPKKLWEWKSVNGL